MSNWTTWEITFHNPDFKREDITVYASPEQLYVLNRESKDFQLLVQGTALEEYVEDYQFDRELEFHKYIMSFGS